MSEERELDEIARGRHLRLVRRDGWEFVQRSGASGVVIVVGVTEQENVLFVEQYRAPVHRRVIEFPAGLAGDIAGAEDEPLAAAASRELVEETGYEAARITQVFTGASSAGLTDETATFFLASGLTKVGAGGGVENERITVHEVPVAEVDRWLEQAAERDCLVGARVYSGLYFLHRHLRCGEA